MSHNDQPLIDGFDTGTLEDIEAVQVFDAYLAEIQAGRPPDPERLVAQHPALADRLRAFLNVTHMVDHVAGDSQPALEDYRIIREIGRGGMGIVYEAEQVSRGRHVALKVLASAAALDPRQLRRFHVEVQAAQLLRHPHIVPVAAFGCERGVYFYAMQYIEGRDLAAWIAGRREAAGDKMVGAVEPKTIVSRIGPVDPKVPSAEFPPAAPQACNGSASTRDRDSFHTIARLSLQAAEALDHAHEQGVLHRDIKPSNLLIDVRGNLWVTDFGLAQVQGEDGVTRTGDLLGTLRYMSPEQALAQRVVIDGRTDIYSLGVTLYELLTLHAAFEGSDRQELLRRIAEEEPRPPRRFTPTIPRDLETIVLKAIAKDRESRYGTAQELAEDLRRFLDDQPIRAKRPTFLERMTKWARRHQAATAAAFTILAVAVVALSVSTALIVREQKRTAEAARRSYYESLVQQILRLRLTAHSNGWSDRALDLIRQAVRLPQDHGALRDQAASTLIGMDAHLHKRLPTQAATLVFDPKRPRLMMSDRQGGFTIWDSAIDEIQDQDSTMDGPIHFAFCGDGTPLQLGPTRGTESARPSLRLRDGARQQIIRTFAIPGDARMQLLAYALSPEGTLVGAVSGTADGELVLTVWEAASGRVLRSFPSRADGLAFSPDASLLAAWDKEGTVTVWSLPEGGPVATLAAGNTSIRCVAFRRDLHRPQGQGSAGRGWLLAAGDAGGTMTVWDLRPKLPVTYCHGSHYGISAVAFSPDAVTVASAGRGVVKLWDAATGRPLLDLAPPPHLRGDVTSLAFSPDGKRLAVGSIDNFSKGGVDVWLIEAGRGVLTLRGFRGQVAKVRYSPDGHLLAALSHDWRVGIWDLSEGRLRHVLTAPRGEFADNAALAFDPAGKRLAFAAGTGAVLWDLATGEPVASWSLPIGFVDHLAFPSDGKLILFRVETRESRVPPYGTDFRKHPRVCRIRDLFGPAPLKPIAEIGAYNRHVFAAAASADGRSFVVEGLGGPAGNERAIKMFDGSTGAERWSVTSRRTTDGTTLALDPGGEILAVVLDDGPTGTLMEAASGRLLGSVEGYPGSLAPAARHWARVMEPSLGYSLFRRGDERPLVNLGIDMEVSSVMAPFDASGGRLAWGAVDGSVLVCDLKEAQRRLAGVGLDW
jgi:serine/threonine protein kinase/WD40 repeat protein